MNLRKNNKLYTKIFKSEFIFFPVRYPNDEEIRDGFFQRVVAIDEIVKNTGLARLYVSKPLNFSFFPVVKEIRKGIFEIEANEKNPFHILYLTFLALHSRAIYLHSVRRIKSPLHILMFLAASKRVIDLHGAVPEELLLHNNVLKSKFFNRVENFVIKHSDIIISVTGSMDRYIKEKIGLKKKKWTKEKKYIQLPIFSKKKGSSNIKQYSKKVIYCGGIQKWQKIESMLKFISQHKDEYSFTFLVTNPDEIKKQYRDSYGEDFPGILQSVPHDKAGEWYENNNFGLVMRDNIVVNRVACPTKLIEYLQYDIVPIVYHENIGDFKDLGYRFVRHDEGLPDDNLWKEMVSVNRVVLEKLSNISKKGADLLIESI